MDGFEQQLAACSAFFVATAQIGGGLLGLVFVAMTFDRDRRGLVRDGAMHALAQQVYLDFLGVLVCSLLLIVPTLGRINHGLLLLVVGGVLAVRTVRGMAALRRPSTATDADWAGMARCMRWPSRSTWISSACWCARCC